MTQYKKLDLDVRGMTCATCPDHVERALRQVAGVKSVEIANWQSSRATVIAEAKVSEEALAAAVKRAEYQSTVTNVSTVADTVEQRGLKTSNGNGKTNFDLLVIGAGSAGFVAAVEATELGGRGGL